MGRTLANGMKKGHIVDVYFKPDRILCEYCGMDKCRHVEFALSIPKVKKTLIQKRLANKQKNKRTMSRVETIWYPR